MRPQSQRLERLNRLVSKTKMAMVAMRQEAPLQERKRDDNQREKMV